MMGQEQAEAISAQALEWLAGDVERMSGFLGATGLDLADLTRSLTQGEGFEAILSYILSEDRLVLAFAEQANLPPQTVVDAQSALPGGQLPHWT